MGQTRNSPAENTEQMTQGTGGFGYELLRSQLDEVQESISQLQQSAVGRDDCTAQHGTAMATILNRLEAIEKKLV
uniref:Uncharacterized protein n=1 Tax=Anopheles dirus TaxID=7168 RepID=A0A182NT71_9DIPT